MPSREEDTGNDERGVQRTLRSASCRMVVWFGHTFVAGHHDVAVHLEVLAEQVAKGVVFFEQYKIGRVGHSCRDNWG